MFGIRRTLRVGSFVFGLSAVLLLVAPAFFLDLLALESSDSELIWAMRMIGITLIALAGNMWANANTSNESRIRFVGKIMSIAALALGLLTTLIPVEMTWFAILYAVIGFAFGLNYLVCLLRRKH